jgi:competence protein ComEC
VLAWSAAAGGASSLAGARIGDALAAGILIAVCLARRPLLVLAFVVFVTAGVLGSWRLSELGADPLRPLVGHRVSGVVTVTGNWSGTSPSHRADAGFVDEDGSRGRILLRLYTWAEPPPRGTRLAVTGRLGRPRRAASGFDEAGLAARRGIRAVLTPTTTTVVGRRGGLQGAADGLRARALIAFAGAGSGDSAHLLAGLAIGADDRLSRRAADDMTEAGLSHLTAVSGENVALLVTLVVATAWLLGAGRRLALTISLGALAVYVAVVGPSASVQRAALVGVVVALAWLASRPADPWHALGAAAAILLVWNPWSLLDVGFQLSFTAVVAILVAVRPLHRLLEGTPVPSLIAPGLAVTVACTLATAPIVWFHFGQLRFVGALPANVLAEPAVAPITWLGVGAAVLQPVDAGLASGLATIAGPLCAYVLLVARVCAAIERAAAPWEPALLVATAATLGVAAVALASRRR